MSEWTDELKQQVVDEYVAANPTPENSMEIVQNLADEHSKTVNGVRMILTKAGVYVKKAEAAKSSSGSSTSKRVSKEDSLNALRTAIKSKGLEADDEIISKLTGKAAVYLADIINKVNGDS